MAQSTAGSYGTGTPIPDGIEAYTQHYNYPEVIHSPPVVKDEQWQQSTPPAAAAVAPEKKIFGLRRTTFILSVLLALVVVGAAVGGGVGGSMAVKSAYNRGLEEASATTTEDPTKTGDRIQAPPTEGLAGLDCPNISDTTRHIDIGGDPYSFRLSCGTNHPNGDLAVLPAYSLNDCITACAAFNRVAAVDDTKCVLAHFNANLGLRKANGGNCWLKQKIGNMEVNNNARTRNNQVDAELVTT